jgi:hypothetical protein
VKRDQSGSERERGKFRRKEGTNSRESSLRERRGKRGSKVRRRRKGRRRRGEIVDLTEVDPKKVYAIVPFDVSGTIDGRRTKIGRNVVKTN